MKNTTLLFALLVMLAACVQSTRKRTIVFAVDARQQENLRSIAVRGGMGALSWENNMYLDDADGDKIYTGTVTVDIPYDAIELKFVKNENEFELMDKPNRQIVFGNNDTVVVRAVFDKLP